MSRLAYMNVYIESQKLRFEMFSLAPRNCIANCDVVLPKLQHRITHWWLNVYDNNHLAPILFPGATDKILFGIYIHYLII